MYIFFCLIYTWLLISFVSHFRMKVVLIICAIIGYAIAVEYTIESCKCWKNYISVQTPEGVKCVGTITRDYHPCDVPEPPKCVCTKEETTSILKDYRGVFCKNKNNEWPCENTSEWETYTEACVRSGKCWVKIFFVIYSC